MPLGLYIHFPWCIKKCPYCDFNSHQQLGELPFAQYCDRLIEDLTNDMNYFKIKDEVTSIFLGGGTPSLVPAKYINKLLTEINNIVDIRSNIEITMETNPGTNEFHPIKDYYDAGINRLSIGAQSFDNQHLLKLGRIHEKDNTLQLISDLRSLKFTNFNLDIMYGLVEQTINQALEDLELAITENPQHISWYNLTIEANTKFAHNPPTLTNQDDIALIEQYGKQLLNQHGYQQYEISAYCKPGFSCQHNLNYWQYGDFIGIGAGAHSKITLPDKTIRLWKQRQPKKYLSDCLIQGQKQLQASDILFEFMLNNLRLQKFNLSKMLDTPRLDIDNAMIKLQQASDLNYLTIQGDSVVLTKLGSDFVNDILQLFLH